MVLLTREQRKFIVKTFYETGSVQRTRFAFADRFPGRQLPVTTGKVNHFKEMFANLRGIVLV